MGLYTYDSTEIPKSDRIPRLVENLYAKMPEIEPARAVLLTGQRHLHTFWKIFRLSSET